MSLIIIDGIKDVWNDNQKKNNYSIFDVVKESYGVYVFRDPNNDEILYIGEARRQSLKDRVTQNFTETDTGGTFRENYMEQNSSTFEGFKKFISSKQILFITAEKGMLIRALEAILIATLTPKFNLEK